MAKYCVYWIPTYWPQNLVNYLIAIGISVNDNTFLTFLYTFVFHNAVCQTHKSYSIKQLNIAATRKQI